MLHQKGTDQVQPRGASSANFPKFVFCHYIVYISTLSSSVRTIDFSRDQDVEGSNPSWLVFFMLGPLAQWIARLTSKADIDRLLFLLLLVLLPRCLPGNSCWQEVAPLWAHLAGGGDWSALVASA
jgi:hypothetical protein